MYDSNTPEPRRPTCQVNAALVSLHKIERLGFELLPSHGCTLCTKLSQLDNGTVPMVLQLKVLIPRAPKGMERAPHKSLIRRKPFYRTVFRVQRLHSRSTPAGHARRFCSIQRRSVLPGSTRGAQIMVTKRSGTIFTNTNTLCSGH